jgi:hypothetical protein
MRKALAIVSIGAFGALGAFGLVPTAVAQQPGAGASKACSGAAEEEFGDTTIQTPGGVKCVGVGETCSHKPGYGHAYRSVGLHCNSKGRLERN